MKHTIKTNIISAIIGIAIGTPIALYARHSDLERLYPDKFPSKCVEAVYAAENGIVEAIPAEDTDADEQVRFSIQMLDRVKAIYVIQEHNDVVNASDEYVGDDLALLAALIHAEAGNQDMVGKRLVADVVLNRVASPKYPNTIEAVIYQSGQFSPVSDGSLARALNGGTTADDIEAARLALIEGRIDTEVLYFTAGGYGRYGAPAYQHGSHYFCK